MKKIRINLTEQEMEDVLSAVGFMLESKEPRHDRQFKSGLRKLLKFLWAVKKNG